MSKILSLTSENIKRLRAVHITPGGSHVAIVGQNEQGKTSVIDSITYALGGLGLVCERPIRDGESVAKSIVELDDLIVTRTFTAAGGGTLKVEGKDGKKLSSPQAVLDNLVGTLTFDPLAFTRLKPEAQADVLRKLIGIDTTALDAEHAKLYLERTDVNRALSTVNSKIGNQTVNNKLPLTEIDVRTIIAERDAVVKKNDAIRSVHDTRDEIRRGIHLTERDKIIQDDLIQSLERQLAEARHKRTLLEVQRASLEDQLKALVVPEFESLKGFDDQVLNAQTTNAAIRANNELRVQFESRAGLMKKSGDLTKRLDDITAAKAKQIADAKYPIQGLGFSSLGTVTFNGIPFEQLSTAQRLKISAAIGFALNPKLRVMLIRDGSVMDENTLADLIKVAAAHDTQLWIERVGKTLDGELPGVIIEDGTVVQSTLPQIPEAPASGNTACV
jgi:hypothetical protein